MNTDRIFDSDFPNNIPVELLSSLIVMLIIIIFSFVVYFKQKKVDPLDKPKGIVAIMEMAIEKMDNKIGTEMGPLHLSISPYFMCLAAYIFLGFILGMTGFPVLIYLGENSQFDSSKLFTALPNTFTNLTFPLIIGLISWILIQACNIRFNKVKYLKQFVSPIPVVGVLTVFSPLISLTFRLFGNALAGFCLSTITYFAISQIANGFGLILVPAVMPFFHAYFDIFSGFIQTLVFVTLSMMDIANEGPSVDEQLQMVSLKYSLTKELLSK